MSCAASNILCLTHTLVDPQIDRSKGVANQEAFASSKKPTLG